MLEERCTGTDLVLYGTDDATQAVCAEYLAQRFRHESPRYRIYVLKGTTVLFHPVLIHTLKRKMADVICGRSSPGGFTEYCKHYAFYCDAMSVVQTHSVDPTTYISYPNAIVPDLLYLGGLQEAMCLENMHDLKITHVVSRSSAGFTFAYTSKVQVTYHCYLRPQPTVLSAYTAVLTEALCPAA